MTTIEVKMYEGTTTEMIIKVNVDFSTNTYKAKYPKMPKGFFHSFLNDFGSYFQEQHPEIYSQLS